MRTVWVLCVIRLLFYAAALPLWEGYDEWGHFAVIRAVGLEGRMLPDRNAPIQRDVQASLEMAPVPWSLNYLPAPSVTQDAFWLLPETGRAERERALRALPSSWMREKAASGLTQYEGQQPPLYYWLMAPFVYLARDWGLSAQVMLVRFVSALIASLAVPLVFLIGRVVLRDAKAALGCAALVAAMPGFALDVARVGNECLGIVLFSALILWGLSGPAGKMEWALGMGVILGSGLLTKAYFLTAAVALVLFFRRRSIPAVALGGAIGGWWYLRNMLTGTFSGLNDSNSIQRVSPGEMLHRALGIPWLKAADTILFSHLYFGGWSSLSVRSWMYHVFYAVIFLGAAGAIWLWRERSIAWIWLVYGLFWLGLFYFALLLYVAHEGGGSPGWYLYAVVGAEVTLCTAGLYRILPRVAHQWVLPAGVFLFAALDFYTMNALAIPYYTGMIRHRTGGTLAALHLADFQSVGLYDAALRLCMFKPAAWSAPILTALWLGYVLATVGLVAIATRYRGKVR